MSRVEASRYYYERLKYQLQVWFKNSTAPFRISESYCIEDAVRIVWMDVTQKAGKMYTPLFHLRCFRRWIIQTSLSVYMCEKRSYMACFTRCKKEMRYACPAESLKRPSRLQADAGISARSKWSASTIATCIQGPALELAFQCASPTSG